MTILKKVWAFIRKWWIWLGVGLVLTMLLIRRGVIMAGLSKLRRELAAKTQALKDYEFNRSALILKEDIAEREARVTEMQTEITGLQDRIDDLRGEHDTVLEAIDGAKNWEELEKLREAGNAR